MQKTIFINFDSEVFYIIDDGADLDALTKSITKNEFIKMCGTAARLRFRHSSTGPIDQSDDVGGVSGGINYNNRYTHNGIGKLVCPTT